MEEPLKRWGKAGCADMKNYRLPLATALTVISLLTLVQLMPKKPLLLLERAFSGGGWLQILLVALYAFVVAYNMQDPAKSALWRRRTWFFFSIVFFGQLALGLFVSSFFLMTGKLHLPIPALIIAGPLYRGEGLMMPVLLLTTVLLSGPAWCSHICYFGGFDNLAATVNNRKTALKGIVPIKQTIVLMVIAGSILLRLFGVPLLWAASLALAFGLAGVVVILLYSRRNGKMMHCTVFCPVGTLVHYLKFISPFRLEIMQSCTTCGRCSSYCSYGALGTSDLVKRRPGRTCTLCGDCLASCPKNSLQYRCFNASAARSRTAWLLITISLHAVTLAVARI
jgi:ferredoxin-type protein NapH